METKRGAACRKALRYVYEVAEAEVGGFASRFELRTPDAGWSAIAEAACVSEFSVSGLRSADEAIPARNASPARILALCCCGSLPGH